MNSQTASWNRLEVLLNEASAKKQPTTPKNGCKQEGSCHPHLLRCMRNKKGFKGCSSSNQAPKSGEVVISARENMITDPAYGQSKSVNDVGTGAATSAKTFVTLRDGQRKSIGEIEHYSGLSGDDKDYYQNNSVDSELEDIETGNDVKDPQSPRLGSTNTLDIALATGWNQSQKKQKTLCRQSSVENAPVLKRYEPVCGIDDNQIRELYRLKCQDLKIGTFADSEDSFLLGLKKKSSHNKLCLLENLKSGFGPRAIEKLGQIIQTNSRIVHLYLRKSTLNEAAMRSFSRSLSLMPCLLHLELANNAIEPQDFIILFEELANSKTLVSIDFSNYEPDKKNRFTIECLENFRKFAAGNVFLQYVKLANLMLEDEVLQGILAALEGTPNLLSLNLSSNNCTGKSLERLSFLFSRTSIIRFDLSNNKLKKEGTGHISKAIQGFKGQHRGGLELMLENTQIGADINVIFASFGRETNVAKLNFANNFLSNVEIMRLENTLSENIKLMELDLSHCKIGEMGGRILALGLQKNNYLQNLVLLNNDLGDITGALIIYSLIHNHSFRSLDISQNNLASESAKALQEMMKKNPNVEKYNLSMNKFNEKEGYLLQEVLYFNAKIIQFNVHHNPVKYNTIETVERIVKDNQKKLMFQAVPKLKNELARKRVFIEDERHAIGEAVEMERVKGDVKRDVERFQDTLISLKNRSESPTVKRNEKLVVKLGKELRIVAKEHSEIVQKTRDFNDEAFLESETYKRELENVNIHIKQCTKKVDAKKRELEEIKAKYEPELKKLRSEISQLKEENRFMEMYNDTINRKIRKEKKKLSVSNRAPNPKISDMFLATSELARHKKKHNETQDKTCHESRSRIAALESHSHFSQISEDSKITREYNFALRNQQFRINRLMKDGEKKDLKNKKRKVAKSETPDQENIKQRIKEKIKNLLKDTEGGTGSILGQIVDN